MKTQFRAIVNKKYSFNFNSENIRRALDLVNNPVHLGVNGREQEIKVISSDFYNRIYTFKINAGYYHVTLKNELQLLIEELGLSDETKVSSNNLIAPMPGLIVDVLVKPGMEVKKGDGLLVLEAMKMENKLTASSGGIIKSVFVKSGETVDKGIVLVEFEK